MKPWHQKPFEQFANFKNNDKLPHALIISGTKGIGKVEFAQHLVQYLSGIDVNRDNLKKVDEELLLRNSIYQHLIYIMPEKTKSGKVSNNISINQIRAFSEFLYKTSSALQIGIIIYGDELMINASNALLKTLEEPRANTLIMILTHNLRYLSNTIISRCAHIHISANKKSLPWIRQYINNSDIDDNELMTLLEENSFTPKKVVDKINSGIYQQEHTTKEELLTIAAHPLKINTLSYKDNITLILHSLFTLLKEISVLQHSKITSTHATKHNIVERAKPQHIIKLLSDIEFATYLLTTTINPKLLLDNILIVWSHITHLDKYPVIFDK